jgi:multimeric flavodoxin WrbA
LRDAALTGAAEGDPALEVRSLGPLDCTADDVLESAAILLFTPTHFGSMAGLVKDWFERIWQPCLDRTVGRPFGLAVKGSVDVDGGVASVEKLAVAGLRWKPIAPVLTVVGDVDQQHLDAAWELGATMAAGLAEHLW